MLSNAIGGGLLISADWDGTLRAWATDTGECLRVVRTHPAGGSAGVGVEQNAPLLASLVAVGSGVVGGFVGGEVRVFDVWTGLAPEHVLRRPSCGCVQVPPSNPPPFTRRKLCLSRPRFASAQRKPTVHGHKYCQISAAEACSSESCR
jgi:hypothetical protein